jgi:hypothetical protein
VSELSRDPEAGIDKTKHLQQLVDAILAASGSDSSSASAAGSESAGTKGNAS